MAAAPEELLCAAAKSGEEEEVAKLLASGTDATHFDADGLTPLMHAAAGGHAGVARLLLDCGAPWNALSPSGLSAGDLASDPDTYDILLDHALRSELVLGTVARRQAVPANASDGAPAESYLESRVSFSEERVMDAESKAVMMAWERPLMEAHARAVCQGGGKVLNVGFGMGLVDEAIQRYEPEEHTIVEAHPEVYERMLKLGWGEKKNVRIVFGRWQDVMPQLGSYDGITYLLPLLIHFSVVMFGHRCCNDKCFLVWGLGVALSMVCLVGIQEYGEVGQKLKIGNFWNVALANYCSFRAVPEDTERSMFGGEGLPLSAVEMVAVTGRDMDLIGMQGMNGYDTFN
ncbi:unnamed protein product [Miscanthus lutarioriparius]|uniref:Protein arginine N-methyltransferase 2 n=1 Tax=Miscanthus lutarioriparius TaxID=422564 RepID=A0A811SNL7_9POAL|nr:unnamed protein product [Miscanthus lutarioriparius]